MPKNGIAAKPASELTLMMCPRCCWRMSGSTALTILTTPKKFQCPGQLVTRVVDHDVKATTPTRNGFDARAHRVIGAYIQRQHLDTGDTVGT